MTGLVLSWWPQQRAAACMPCLLPAWLAPAARIVNLLRHRASNSSQQTRQRSRLRLSSDPGRRLLPLRCRMHDLTSALWIMGKTSDGCCLTAINSRESRRLGVLLRLPVHWLSNQHHTFAEIRQCALSYAGAVSSP
jgi:hypothetical protein